MKIFKLKIDLFKETTVEEITRVLQNHFRGGLYINVEELKGDKE